MFPQQLKAEVHLLQDLGRVIQQHEYRLSQQNWRNQAATSLAKQ